MYCKGQDINLIFFSIVFQRQKNSRAKALKGQIIHTQITSQGNLPEHFRKKDF